MNAVQAGLAALVCKSGVGLGGLPQAMRVLALAVPALVLAPGTDATEPEVNALLKQALAGAAQFLDTDHVELRRWLIDTGWWQRDGFGHAYRRTPADGLSPLQAQLLRELQGLDLPAWVARQREAHRRRRAARKRDWAARPGGAAHG
jgi:hypothetical protein